MHLDVEELVRGAAAGDVPAFVELTRCFQHAAFGSPLALMHDVDAAEDVVQEAFLTAWSALPRLDDPAAFPGWQPEVTTSGDRVLDVQFFGPTRQLHRPTRRMSVVRWLVNLCSL